MKGNFKAVIVCLLAVVWLGFLSEKADAFSVQPRYTIGAMSFEKVDSFSANSIGLDVFVYEGGNLDIFLGAEQNSVSFSGRGQGKQKISAKATAYDIGFRFKPTTSWRYKPYFLVGLSYFQNINYDEVKLENPDLILISYSQPDIKIGGMAGVGTDIGISDRLAFVAQLVGVGYPDIKVTYRNTGGGGTQTAVIGTGFIGINLGLKYSF